MFVEWHRQIGARIPVSANQVLKLPRHCYATMVEWEKYWGSNPCQGIKPFPRPPRKRAVQLVQPGIEMTRIGGD